ncbi:MAG: hypothetical protein K0M56_08090 [Kaistella sp.]|nr:hypothetical protein [Kaistella sp.]
MMNKKIIKYIFAIVVFILPIYIYFSTPSDTDGGPMLAYNFLFFYPILFISTLISFVLIIISLTNFKHKKIENLLILFSTVPTILLLVLFLIHISNIQKQIKNENLNEETELKVSTEMVKLNDNLTINLDGYQFKNVRRKITFTPNKQKSETYTSNQFTQGNYDSFFLFYKVHNDSLEIYIPEDEPLYYLNDGNEKLPLKAIQIKSIKIDSLNKSGLKQFQWK